MSIQNFKSSFIFRKILLPQWKELSAANRRYIETNARKTALYDFHVSQGGKMVNFANFLLPVNYKDKGITGSHLHTREFASIFDVSHMLQTHIRGKAAIECFESISPADLRTSMGKNCSCLTVFTDNDGHILDDLIVSKIDDDWLYIVSNAGRREQDMNIMEDAARRLKALGKDVSVEFMPTNVQSLIAFQGPVAVKVLSGLVKSRIPLENLYFMQTTEAEVAGVSNCRITRCGYTGEDGVEISVPSWEVRNVTEAILAASKDVRMAGLGARDSLRLEAGLCLYGLDIDAYTTPVEASLTWLVTKRRREEMNFPGAKRIINQLQNGVERRRIGLQMFRGPSARNCTEMIYNDKRVGKVTSGCPSPTLGGNIAMGYIREDIRKLDLFEIQLKIRGKLHPARITQMPFVRTRYYSKPKTKFFIAPSRTNETISLTK